MIRNFLIIAFMLSAIAACDRNDKTMDQEKAEEMPVEQLNEDVQNKAENMLDAVEDTAGKAVDDTQEMADDVADATMDAYDKSKDAVGDAVDGAQEMTDDMKDATMDAYDASKDAMTEAVEDIEQNMDDETK